MAGLLYAMWLLAKVISRREGVVQGRVAPWYFLGVVGGWQGRSYGQEDYIKGSDMGSLGCVSSQP